MGLAGFYWKETGLYLSAVISGGKTGRARIHNNGQIMDSGSQAIARADAREALRLAPE